MSLLSVRNLGKAYCTYHSEWHRFARWFGIPIKPAYEQWVLRNVDFEMQPGEAIGIIGFNGAGKSTLLKMIAGTSYPTEGQVNVRGRIAAILELGMGFDPELTGRENVFYAAGLMGYSYEQAKEAMPDIEAFAEIGEYFDQAVRTYSSGMQVRVAFSVATAYRPEILIIDEALSVGDTYFQHKSFNRIREYRKQGTSLLIVSHDKSAIQSVCDKAILFNKGAVELIGTPEYVMDYYSALSKSDDESDIRTITPKQNAKKVVVSGNGSAVVDDVKIYDSKGRSVAVVYVGQSVELRVTVCSLREIDRLILGYLIKDRLGREVFGTNTHLTKQEILNCSPGEKYVFRITFKVSLGVGTYSIATALVDTTDTNILQTYEWNELAVMFEVINTKESHFVGTAWIPPEIEINKL